MRKKAILAVITVMALMLGTFFVPQPHAMAEDILQGLQEAGIQDERERAIRLNEKDDALTADVVMGGDSVEGIASPAGSDVWIGEEAEAATHSQESSESASGADSVEAREKLDLQPYITSAHLWSANGDNWIPMDNPDKPFDGDPYRVKFDFAYTLPAGSVTPQNPSVQYQLPHAMLNADGKCPNPPSGEVRNSTGQKVGEYVVDERGLVTITFTDNHYLDSTSGIEGTFFIVREANQVNIKEPIDINENLTITPVYKKKTDLRVSKSYQDLDAEAGTVKFTVVVKSEHGTNGQVVLHDVMQSLELEGTVSIDPKPSNNAAAVLNGENNGFDVTLPEFTAGQEYRITYTAKLPASMQGQLVVSGKNTASATWHDVDGKEQTAGPASVDVTFDRRGVSVQKNAVTDKDQQEVHWSITITSDADGKLDGWTVTDLFNDVAINKNDLKDGTDFVLKAPDGSEVHLDSLDGYVFGSGTKAGTYTISYVTPMSRQIGKKSHNKVTLTPPNDPQHPTSSEAWAEDAPSAEGHDYLDKEASGYTTNANGTITINWKLAVDSTAAPLPAGWQLQDDLAGGDHKFSKDEMEGMLASLNKAMNAIDYKSSYTTLFTRDDGQSVDSLDRLDGKPVREFKITFAESLPQGKRLVVEFTSTSTHEIDHTKKEEFGNQSRIYVNGEQVAYDKADVKVLPTKPHISKVDATNEGGGTSTNHPYVADLQLKWRVELYIPEGFTQGEITMTETLPENLRSHIVSAVLGLKGDAGKSHALPVSEGRIVGSSIALDSISNAVTVSTDGDGIIALTVSESFSQAHKDRTLTFDLVCDLPEHFVAPTGSEVRSFENTASFTWHKEEGSATQTQIVGAQQSAPAMKKMWLGEYDQTSNNNMIKDNHFPYSVTINPEGRDMLPGTNTLTFVDTLTYNPYKWENGVRVKVNNVSLVPGSVKVYRVTESQTKGELLPITDYPYEYKENERISGDADRLRNVISMTIPDGMPLIVEYAYLASGLKDANNNYLKNDIEAKNDARIEGHGETSSSQVSGKIGSGATANISGVTLFKVDAANQGTHLLGATFKLEKWSAPSGQAAVWVEVASDLTTDADGKVVLRDPVNGKPCVLEHNVAYKLTETKAPGGYLLDSNPYLFMVVERCDNCDKLVQPYGFNGVQLHDGAVIYRPNQSLKTRIGVEKMWFKHGDSSITDTGSMEDVTGTWTGSISFKLMQTATTHAQGTTFHNLKVIAEDVWDSNYFAVVEDTKAASGSQVQIAVQIPESEKDSFKGIFLEAQRLDEPKRDHVYENGILMVSVERRLEKNDTITVKHKVKDTYHDIPNPTSVKISQPPSNQLPNPETLQYGETHTLSDKDGWRKTIEDLPYHSYDNQRRPVTYTYHVEEVTNTGHLGYVNNGIESGTISIKNRAVEPPVLLPGTGGMGTPLEKIGLMICSCVVAAYLVRCWRRSTAG